MSKEAVSGCAISFLIFVLFFGVGLFACAGGLYLFFQGIKFFSESFWRVLETVGGFIIMCGSPFFLIRVALKYKLNKERAGVDKPS